MTYGDTRHSTDAELLENGPRREAMHRDLDYHFGTLGRRGRFGGDYPHGWTTDERIADLRRRYIWTVDDEALARLLLAAEANPAVAYGPTDAELREEMAADVELMADEFHGWPA